jgi:hypothetical protein
MLVRALLTLLAAVIIGGCSSSGGAGYTPKESEGVNTRAQERGTLSGATEPPENPAVGEAIDRTDFEIKVLEVTRSEDWFYPDTEEHFPWRAQSYAGKFAIVWYSVRNTGTAPLNIGKLGDSSAGTLTADTGESFNVSEDAKCGPVEHGVEDLAPRDLQLGCMIFDAPADAQPERVAIRFGKAQYEPATVDLTRAQPESVEPDERLGLFYEYNNVQFFDLAYAMFSEESRAQFTFEQYETLAVRDFKQDPVSDYAFPSVTIQGDEATVERIMTAWDYRNYETTTSRRTQHLVREGGVWRIVARDDQIEYFSNPEDYI